MDSLSYQVVFDVARQGPQDWWLLGVPLLMLAAGIVMLRTAQSKGRRRFLIVWTAGVGVLAVLLAATVIAQYASMRSALGRGQYQIVEGVVSEFVPADEGDHTPEHFVVATRAGRFEYAYSWSVITQGFHQSQHHGGPIRNGLRVRIADVNGQIARLEIAP